jgi:lysozyme family protein
MTDFEICIAKTLDIEMGFVDNPNDAGGATNFGLSLRFMQRLSDTDKDGYADGDIDRDGDVDIDDIKKLTLPNVHRILKAYFWDTLPVNEASVPLSIKWKLFDISVNCSPVQAIKMLQRALKVEADGVFGIKSWESLHTLSTDTVLAGLAEQQMKHYSACVVNRPANLTFLRGWTERAFEQLEVGV